MAEALYRKYRPQIFEDVVGQEHIERTIKNAIEQDKVSHAYLFTGPRGTGKTTTARLLAKALLCERGPTAEPDGTCSNCEAIAVGNHPDVYELDAASRTGVENVREEIIGRVQFAPTQGRSKVYIIDEVHMLSTAAFNALLKTLEEPPSHVVFILCTTDPQKVPETIHSRCQRFDFRRISVEAMVSRLGAICVAEDVEFEGEALDLIAHRAEGGMRNALTSLEQLIAFGEGKVSMETAERLLGSLDSNDMAEIVGAIGRRDVARCFTWTSEYTETGADLAQFARDLSEHIRNMYILSLSDSDAVLEVDDVIRRELAQEMQYFGPDRLSRMLGILGDLTVELKTSSNPRLSFEIALTRMVRPDSDVTLESLAERVEALESGYSAVSHVSSVPLVTPVQAEPAPTPAASVAPAVAPVSASTATPTPVPASAPLQAQTVSVVPTTPAATSVSTSATAPAIPDLTPKPVPDPAPMTSATAPIPSTVSAPAADLTPAQIPEAATCQPSGQASASLTGLSNPASLQRIWQAALQQIKKEKAAYGVLFLNTKVAFDETKQELTIEFPAGNDFAYAAVQKPEAMDVVTRALALAAGMSISFRYFQADATVPATSPATPVAAPVTASVATSVATVPTPTPAAAIPSPPGTASTTPPAASAATSFEIPAPAPTQAPTAAVSAIDSAPGIPQNSPATSEGTASDAPESEVTPLDAYDDYVPSSEGDAPVMEDDLKSMLMQGFGEGIKFDTIDDD